MSFAKCEAAFCYPFLGRHPVGYKKTFHTVHNFMNAEPSLGRAEMVHIETPDQCVGGGK
jgi:hypothetical protein